MKNECNIVRDLLPLCIDGAASEDSRRLVEEHTALCESCARERREMMLALPENQESQAGQDLLKKAAQKLRRKHLRRGWIMAIVGLLLGIALMLSGLWLYDYLAYTYAVTAPLDVYDVQLSTLENGDLIMSLLRTKIDAICGWSISGQPTADGTGDALNLTLEMHLIPRETAPSKLAGTMTFQWKDGKIYDNGTQVTIITRTGPHGEQDIIYQYGADESRITPASEQMETYYKLLDESMLYVTLRNAHSSLWAIIDESELPFMRTDSDDHEFSERLEELYREQQELLPTIPEWQ